jgi:hypothetical protein
LPDNSNPVVLATVFPVDIPSSNSWTLTSTMVWPSI